MNVEEESLILPTGAYDPASDIWRQIDSFPQDIEQTELKLATFNIWFGDYFAQQRYEAIAHLLEAHRPDIIAFQEVTASALQSFLEQPWIRKTYYSSDIDGRTLGDYGVLLLSRLPPGKITLIPLPSFMNRHLLLMEICVNGSPLQVGTVHLESMKSSAAMRSRQLSTIFSTLKESPNVVIMGDFNFCASWPEENAQIDPAFQDVWGQLRGNEPGYTEDTSINQMRYLIKGKHKQVRFDRVLLKSMEQDSGWSASSIELLGTEPISSNYPDVFPSDHFGLLCSLYGTQTSTPDAL